MSVIQMKKADLEAVIAESTKSINADVEKLREEQDKLTAKGLTQAEAIEATAGIQKSIDTAHAKLSEALIAVEAATNSELAEEVKELRGQVKDLQLNKSKAENGSEETLKSFAATESATKLKDFISNPKSNSAKEAYAEEMKALRTDVAAAAGDLVPVSLENEIVKDITEANAIRQDARVVSTNQGHLEVPIRTSIPVALWKGEGVDAEETNSEYKLETVKPHRLTAFTAMTKEMAMNSAFDMMKEIISDFGDSIKVAEGNAWLKGAGAASDQPRGILTTAGVPTVETATSGTLSFDDVKLLAGQLKTGYNAKLYMNRRTKAQLTIAKGSDGQYLWVGDKTKIDGIPVVEVPEMDDIAVGNVPVFYADLRMAYRIYDRKGLEIMSDPYTGSLAGISKVILHKYVDALVAQPEAIVKLQVKA